MKYQLLVYKFCLHYVFKIFTFFGFWISEVEPNDRRRSRKTSGENLAEGIGLLAGGIIGGLMSVGLGNSSRNNVTKPKPKQSGAATHSISVSVNPAQPTVSQNILKSAIFRESSTVCLESWNQLLFEKKLFLLTSRRPSIDREFFTYPWSKRATMTLIAGQKIKIFWPTVTSNVLHVT